MEKVNYCKVFAVEYDGKHIFDVQKETGFTAQGIINYVTNEGGYIDDEGYIRRGSAVNHELEKLKNMKFDSDDPVVNHDRLVYMGIAKDDFILSKQERINHGIEPGKKKVLDFHRYNDHEPIDWHAQYTKHIGLTVLEFMLDICQEHLTNPDYDFVKTLVSHFGGYIDDDGIIH